jgi:hypothetical protein
LFADAHSCSKELADMALPEVQKMIGKDNGKRLYDFFRIK